MSLWGVTVASFLCKSRHSTTYHFRRKVPLDLVCAVGKSHLVASLKTHNKALAIVRARAVASQLDAAFDKMRTMKKQNVDAAVGGHFDWKMEVEFSEIGNLLSMKVEASPEETEAAKEAMVATIQAANAAPHLPATAARQSSGGKRILDVWELFKIEKLAANAWKDGEDTAKYDYLPHIRKLTEVIGNKPIVEVTADDVNAFQTHVLGDPEGGSARNRDKRLTRAGSIFRWAKTKRILSDDFAELFRYPSAVPENPYVAFDVTDLKALFESDEYVRGAFKTPSEYWLPLLGLHTGARLNELCQLLKTDIGNHEGVPTISILIDEEEKKRLKTSASRRIIPIHSTLIECGFLQYVADAKSGRIFPELPEDPARLGNFGAKASEQFTAYRRKQGVGKTTERSNKAFHSFRSTLISALRKAEVPGDRRRRLAGHEASDVHDRNYHGGDVLTMFNFQTLKADIEKARFDVAFISYGQSLWR